jgi:LPS-assembly lipoprotein
MRGGLMRTALRLATAALALALAACGFQLRGNAALPFDTIYFPNTSSGVGLDLKRNIQAGSGTQVVDDAQRAQARLEFVEETRQKEVLSLTGAGRVREFRLGYRLVFRVHDREGRDYVPRTVLQLYRDVTYSDADVLAKQEEEEILYRDMRADAVRQILRRLAGAKAPG